MQGDTNLVIDATRKASRSLQRDFFELENLQSSEKNTSSFCQKSCGKAFQTLHESLGKYYKTVIFNSKEMSSANFTGHGALVETMDGLGNFERSLPYFAIMVTIISKKDGEITAERSIINFPALGEIYYTEKGKGAWFERLSSNVIGASRIRVSGQSNINNALIAPSHDKLDIVNKLSAKLRFFDSYTYSLSQIIRGKIDAMIMNPRDISSPGIQLFLKESGGACSIENGHLIASNFKLHEKIKQLI